MKRAYSVFLLFSMLAGTAYGVNDFSDAVAFWDFEDDLVDALNANNLTDFASIVYSATSKEGTKSADLEITGDVDCAYRADVDLSSGVPFKSGTSNTRMSCCAWVNPESLPGTGGVAVIVSKYRNAATAGYKSFWVGLYNNDDTLTWALQHGYGDGSLNELVSITPDAAPQAANWYHVAFTISGSNWTLNVYDATNDATKTGSGTFPNGATPVSTTMLVVGARRHATSNQDLHWDGLIDECVIWNTVVTDWAAVRAGTYAPPSGHVGGPIDNPIFGGILR